MIEIMSKAEAVATLERTAKRLKKEKLPGWEQIPAQIKAVEECLTTINLGFYTEDLHE